MPAERELSRPRRSTPLQANSLLLLMMLVLAHPAQLKRHVMVIYSVMSFEAGVTTFLGIKYARFRFPDYLQSIVDHDSERM
eukprot:scaffold659_cov329-Prasinococcus_capsulatus_cf.AAC.34